MRVTYRPRGLVRAFIDAGQPLSSVYRTRYQIVPDEELDNRGLDPYRTAWSPGVGLAWSDNVYGGAYPDGGVTFTSAGRLYVTNPGAPPQVYPGDEVGPGVASLVRGAGQLRQGITWRHSDGTTSEAVLAEIPAAGDQANYHVPVPATATHADVWLETTGAGWKVSGASVSTSSETIRPATLTIRRGRSSEMADLEPSTVSGTLALAGAAPLSTGQEVFVDVNVSELEARGVFDWYDLGQRFAGVVSDVDAVLTPGGPNQVPIVSTSLLSRLPSITLGDTPWPAESALERGARILQLALDADPYLPAVVPTGAGGLTVAARDVDAQPADALLAELTSHAGVRLVETRAGEITMVAAPPRSTAPSVTLTPAHFARPLRMSQETSPRRVRVTYGPSSDRQTLDVSLDPPGTAQGAARVPELDTTLADADAALLRARRELAAGAAPVWRVRAVLVDVLRLLERDDPGDLDVVAALLRLELGDVAQLDDLPAQAPALAGGGRVVIQGVTETIGPDTWRLALDVVDAPLELADETWADVDAGTDRWLDVDPSISWAAQPAYL